MVGGGGPQPAAAAKETFVFCWSAGFRGGGVPSRGAEGRTVRATRGRVTRAVRSSASVEARFHLAQDTSSKRRETLSASEATKVRSGRSSGTVSLSDISQSSTDSEASVGGGDVFALKR